MAASNRSSLSVLRASELEQMMYTLEARYVSETCFAQATSYGNPYDIHGDVNFRFLVGTPASFVPGGSVNATWKVSDIVIVVIAIVVIAINTARRYDSTWRDRKECTSAMLKRSWACLHADHHRGLPAKNRTLGSDTQSCVYFSTSTLPRSRSAHGRVVLRIGASPKAIHFQSRNSDAKQPRQLNPTWIHRERDAC
jgi:hypothetical protein